MEEVAKGGTIRGIDYKVIRTDEHPNTDMRSYYDKEFVLYLDGESITNARTMEMEGWEGPGWVDNMERYLRAFLDGAEWGAP